MRIEIRKLRSTSKPAGLKVQAPFTINQDRLISEKCDRLINISFLGSAADAATVGLTSAT